MLAAAEGMGTTGVRASAAGGVPRGSLSAGAGTKGGATVSAGSTAGRDCRVTYSALGSLLYNNVDFAGRGGYTLDTARLRRGSGGPSSSWRAK